MEAKIICDSINDGGDRLTTFELEYPRYIHSEVMTHRQFSRNAQSSRAIPVSRLIGRVLDEPIEPIFMMNKKGMSAEEIPDPQVLQKADKIWHTAKWGMISAAKSLNELGIHKQIVNRLLEPFSNIKVILSSTEFNNFFNLRISPAAQQEINQLAVLMKEEMQKSIPKELAYNQYHLPYISQEERNTLSLAIMKQVSVARCARVSYLNHDKTKDIQLDQDLHNRLLRDRHLSPFEHVARPCESYQKTSNFFGWQQYRSEVENIKEEL